MALSIPEYWKLLADSRLLAPERIVQLQQAFAGLKGVDRAGSSRVLAEWLVSEGAVTRYQMRLLAAGRPGPFFYGDYRTEERYESGRFAGKFRAVHVPSGYGVMLDFLSGSVTQNQQLWLTAAQTAERARSVASPHVSRFYELIDLVTFKFAAVEQLNGQSLDELLPPGQALPPAEACRIARSAAIALAQLHAVGIVHGEVRPENVWLEPTRNVKLLGVPFSTDLTTPPGRFSLAAHDTDGKQLTKADYLAPEMAAAGAQATPSADIYALGCLTYRMLTGREPFAGGTAAEKIFRHATEAIQPLEAWGVPQPLAQVVTYMMAKDPGVRFQQAGQVVDALAPFVEPAGMQPLAEPPSPALLQYSHALQQRHASLQKAARTPAVSDSFDVRGTTARGPVGPTIKTDTAGSTSGRSSAYRPRKKSNTNLFVGAGVAVLGLVVAAVIFANKTEETEPKLAKSSSSETVTDVDGETIVPTKGSGKSGTDDKTSQPNPDGGDLGLTPVVRETRIADNGRAMWASPTQGPPLDLRFLPPGAQIFLAVRPAELFLGSQGEMLSAAVDPTGKNYLEPLNQITGFDLEEIEQLVIAFEPAKDATLEVSLAVHLRTPLPKASLLTNWGNPPETKEGARSYYTRQGRAYYIPAEAEGKAFAITSPARIKELIEQASAPPALRLEMEKMLADTDRLRHVTLLYAPNFLFTDGKKAIFTGMAAPLEGPIFDFLGDDKIKSGVLSFHVGENDFFSEMRLGGDLDKKPQNLAAELHGRLGGQVLSKVRLQMIELAAHPYARQLLAEFPEMIRLLSQHTRSDTENNQAVLRSYLPAAAAHNLLFGLELSLSLQGTGGATVATAPKKEGGGTVGELLEKKASLSFPRDTLEVSMQLLAKEIGVEITIIGADLQLDGITKNQSFGIDLRDRPAKEILGQVMLLANPDKTVKTISDPKQKLVYVVKPKAAGQPEMIFITTRAQAEKRGDKLPPEFVAK